MANEKLIKISIFIFRILFKKLTNKIEYTTLLIGPMKRIISSSTSSKFYRFKSDENIFKKFSKTLCLPQTNFSMRSNSNEQEPKLQKIMCDYIYEKQSKSENINEFILHDG
jgi:hypothetical protein